MDWSIQQIAPSDAARIVPLLKQVQAIHVAAHPDMFRADLDEAALVTFLQELLSADEVTALVAVAPDGLVVGYVIFQIETREAWVLKHASRKGHLHHIAVDVGWRRRGVGSGLIAEMKARLRAAGVTRMTTDYFAFNKASAALMRKAGFAPLRVVAEGAV